MVQFVNKDAVVVVVNLMYFKNLEFFLFLNVTDSQCESCRVGAKQYEYIFFWSLSKGNR